MATMDIDSTEYKLSCQLSGHEDDARGICICENGGIATSSRDRTIRFWTLDESNKREYVLSKILLGHTSFVGPLAWIPASDEFPEGGIVSGGMDTLVIAWNLATGESVHTLKGHTLQVSGVTLDGADIVSSSIDCTLRRWRKGQQVEVWEAHKSAVQAVIKLPSGELVTGSSDTTLKLWKGRSCMHTYVGHSDTVRGLAVMHGLGIISASHDGSVRLWSLSGELLMEMVGHTSIVYSVDSHTSGLILSGSEDCSAKIWKDGVCIQSIEHPGCVWDTKFLENGNIVTACSDGVVRIWTVREDKFADSVELQSYASLVSQSRVSRKRVGGLKLEELPGLDALQTPGTIDGQTMVVREGDNGVAYAWNAREHQWDKIGEVIDGPDDNLPGAAGPVLDGVKYDHVFDVDIGDGQPIRKLPYNRSDNPYDVADKWLLKENLPLSYRQQVVEFILQNAGQKYFSLDPSFRDPYTGSSAYVPGQPSKSNASVAKPTFKHIPKKGMLVFEAAQFDGILKKISEFNNSLLSDMNNRHLSLTETDMSRVETIAKNLKDTSRYHISRFSDGDIDLVLKLLISWPVEKLFPVIDLLRMLLLHPEGATMLLKKVNSGNVGAPGVLMELIKKVTSDSPLAPNLLTSIRAVTNLFKNPIFHDLLLTQYSEIIDAFASSYLPSNKNVQLAYSTLLLNYSVLLIEKNDESGQSQILSALLEMAEGEAIEDDTKYRVLVAIGSLMLEGLVKKIALDFDVLSIAKAAKASKDAKVAEVGAEIEVVAK